MGPRMLCSLGYPGSPGGRETATWCNKELMEAWNQQGPRYGWWHPRDAKQRLGPTWPSAWVPWVDPVLSHRQGAKSIFFTSQIFHHSQLQVSVVCFVPQFGMCVIGPLFLASMTLPILTGPPHCSSCFFPVSTMTSFPSVHTPLCCLIPCVPSSTSGAHNPGPAWALGV